MISLRSSDVNLHTCDYCELYGRSQDWQAEMEILTEGAQNGCPRYKAALASADWVVRNFPEYGPAESASLDESGQVTVEYEDCTIVEVELSRFHSKFGTRLRRTNH